MYASTLLPTLILKSSDILMTNPSSLLTFDPKEWVWSVPSEVCCSRERVITEIARRNTMVNSFHERLSTTDNFCPVCS